MKKLDIHSVVKVSAQQSSCELDGEAAILHLDAGLYYGLDGVGARIWSLLETPRPVSEIRDELLKEYDVPAEVCEKDLFGVLSKLLEEDLIEVHS